MEILSQKINALIEDNKITRYKLAKILNCSKQTISNWCDNVTEPTLSYLIKIANYFDVTTDYLLGLEDENGAKVYNNTYNNYGTHKGDVKF